MSTGQNSKSKVIAALIIGLTTFGFAPILVRVAMDTSPFVLVSYRTVLAVVMLLPFWIIYGKKRQVWTINKESLWVVLAGICLGFHFTSWLASLYYTSVASSSVLVTTHPVMMILVERIWFKRRFNRTTWAGVFLAFSGSLILGISDSQISQPFADPLFGNTLAFIAAIIFVLYLLIGQEVRKNRNWIDYVFPVYFYAAITTVVTALILGENLLKISKIGLWAGVGLAFGPQLLGHGAMNYTVKYVSPTFLSTLVLAEPLLASVLAYFIFEEQPPTASIAGMVVILIGITLTWKKQAKPVSG